MRADPFRFALAATAVLVLLGALGALGVPADARAAAEISQDEPIAWAGSYADAVKTAEAEDRPLLFKFYSGWCPHCVRMDRTTWKDETVAELAESFVAAKVNADVEKVPVKRYSLTGYPTVILAEPGGEQVLRLAGYKNATVISAYLTAYLKHADDVHAAFERLRADRKDAAGQLALGDFYAAVGLHAQAAERYEKAADGDEPVLAAIGAARGAVALLEQDEAKAASKLLRRAENAPAEAEPAVLLARGRLEAAQGNEPAARRAWEALVARHADSVEAEAARGLLSGS